MLQVNLSFSGHITFIKFTYILVIQLFLINSNISFTYSQTPEFINKTLSSKKSILNEKWEEGYDALKAGNFIFADSLFENAYKTWRNTFNKIEEFVPGGNLQFYIDVEKKIWYDSVFAEIVACIKRIPDEKLMENTEPLANILFYTGRSRFLVRNFESSIETFQFALSLFDRSGNPRTSLIVDLYEATGDVYEEIREYKIAIAYFKFVKGMHELNFEKPHRRMAIINEKLALCYSHIFDEKFIYFIHDKRTVDISSDYKQESYEINRTLYGEINPYSAVNLFQLGLNKYYEAWYYQDQSKRNTVVNEAITLGHKAAWQLNKIDPDNVKLGNCYNLIASSHQVLSNHDSCVFYLHKTIKTHIKNRGFHHPMTIYAASNLGKKQHELHELDSSLFYYQKSLEYCVPGFRSEDINDNPVPGSDIIDYNFLIAALNGKKVILEDKYLETGDRNFLLLAYETSLLSFEFSKEYLHTEHLSAEYGIWARTLSEMAKNTFEIAVGLDSLVSGDQYVKKSIFFVEESRDLAMKTGFYDDIKDSTNQEEESFCRQEDLLKAQIAEKQNQLLELLEKESYADPSSIISLQKEYLELNKQQNALQKSITSNLTGDDVHRKKGNKSIRQIQKSIKPNSVVLNYIICRNRLWITMISNKEFRTSYISVTKFELEKQVENLVSAIAENVFISNDDLSSFHRFCESSHQLFCYFFPEEVQSFIGEKENLLIIPDDILSFVPFDALITKQPEDKNANYKSLDYLVYHYQIHQHYLLSDLKNKMSNNNPQHFYCGFAPVYDSIEVALLDDQNIRPYTRSLGELKANTDEVNYVSSLFQGKKYIGEAASEDSFIAISSESGILHLAMHAVVDLRNPMSSMLLFSQKDSSANDNKLKLYEIDGQDIRSQLVVLSACNTGYGRLVSGEGVISLSRAFIHSGASSVVSTLWWADDEATKNISIDFFEGVKNGLPLDEALRNSKTKFLSNADPVFAHPYYWANFILVGNAQPLMLNIQNQWSNLYFFVIGIVLVTILILFLFRSRKTSLKSLGR